MEYDKEWAKKIRDKKFQAHNAQWCEIVAHEEKGPTFKSNQVISEESDEVVLPVSAH